MADRVEVEAAGGDVGGDERRHLAAAETLECPLAGALRHVAVHRGRLDPARAQLVDEPVGAALGAHEYEGELPLLAERVDQPLELGGVGDRHELVLDVAVGMARRQLGLEPRRIIRVGMGQLADRAVERGREEHRLTPGGQAPDDPVDLGLEAHVEHPVGLVEDEDPDGLEREQAPLDEIVEPAGGGDDDMRAAQALHLWADRGAAVGGRRTKALRLAEQRELLGHLERELAGGREHERGRGRLAGRDELDDR